MLYVVAFLHLLSAPPQNHRFNAVLRARAGRTIGETPSLYRIMTVRRCFLFLLLSMLLFPPQLHRNNGNNDMQNSMEGKQNVDGVSWGLRHFKGFIVEDEFEYFQLLKLFSQISVNPAWKILFLNFALLQRFLEKQIGKLRVNNFDLFAAIYISKFIRKMEWKVKYWSMNSFWNSFIYLVIVPFRSSPNSHYRRL